MNEAELALVQEMDRLISILNRIADLASDITTAVEATKSHAEMRKGTVEPTWGELTRIARTVDIVDNRSDDCRGVLASIVEMNADLQFILGGA